MLKYRFEQFEENKGTKEVMGILASLIPLLMIPIGMLYEGLKFGLNKKVIQPFFYKKKYFRKKNYAKIFTAPKKFFKGVFEFCRLQTQWPTYKKRVKQSENVIERIFLMPHEAASDASRKLLEEVAEDDDTVWTLDSIWSDDSTYQNSFIVLCVYKIWC